MKFGNFTSNNAWYRNWDIEGIQYIFKATLIVLGVVGVGHIGMAIFGVVFPGVPTAVRDSLSSSLSSLASANQLNRNTDGAVLVEKTAVLANNSSKLISNTVGLVANGITDGLANVAGASVKAVDSATYFAANAINTIASKQATKNVDADIAASAVAPLILTPDTIQTPQLNQGLDRSEPKQMPNTLSASKSVPVLKPVLAVTKEVIPAISADAYMVSDLKTGKTILEHNGSISYPIASISKLVTALTVKKLFSKDDMVFITKDAINTFGDAGKLVEGEAMSTQDLLYPMLIESSNDAAVAYQLQYDQGGRSFVDNMNTIAHDIGMKNTKFAEPSGLSPDNMSTVQDLFKLVQYIKSNNPDVFAITRIDGLEMASGTKNMHHIFKNNNTFAKREDFVGGKTGKTEEALETMATVFRVADKANPNIQDDIAIIVLKSKNRIDDSNKLYTWYMSKFGKIAGSVY